MRGGALGDGGATRRVCVGAAAFPSSFSFPSPNTTSPALRPSGGHHYRTLGALTGRKRETGRSMAAKRLSPTRVLPWLAVPIALTDCASVQRVHSDSAADGGSGDDTYVLVDRCSLSALRFYRPWTRGEVVVLRCDCQRGSTRTPPAHTHPPHSLPRRSPTEPRRVLVQRLIGLEGDWVAVPGSAKVERIPKARWGRAGGQKLRALCVTPSPPRPTRAQGRCWVEGDSAAAASCDSRAFGPVPLALIQGGAVRVCWPPQRWGAVKAELPLGRVVARGGQMPGGIDEEWPWS